MQPRMFEKSFRASIGNEGQVYYLQAIVPHDDRLA